MKYKHVIDALIDDIGPDKHFTSGSVEGSQARGRALSALQKSGDVVCTGHSKNTNAKVYKLTHTQYETLKDQRGRVNNGKN